VQNIQGNFEQPIEYRTETNHLGNFSARYTGLLSKNIYKIWAVALDKNDATSENSVSVVTQVSSRSIGRFIREHLDVIITLFLPLLSLLLTILFFYHLLSYSQPTLKSPMQKQQSRQKLNLIKINTSSSLFLKIQKYLQRKLQRP
jgi:hypothetical protein